MSNFNLTNFVLSSHFGNNKAITDNKNLPSVMVYIPKFKMSDVIKGGSDNVHPAFIVDGEEVSGIWISKYENVLINDIPYSIPGEDPARAIKHVEASRACAEKGAGWHLMNALEWGAIALWCKKNGHLPYGNTRFGRDPRETEITAVPSYIESGKIIRIATGTGAPTWSHNGKLDGIYDLNGNVAELCGGVRFVYGELQILENSRSSTESWKAIDGTTGALITPKADGTTINALRLSWESDTWKWITDLSNTRPTTSKRTDITAITVDNTICTEAKELLYALGFLSDDASFDYRASTFNLSNFMDYAYGVRGGANGEDVYGIFNSRFNYSNNGDRWGAHGFRSAYYE